MKSNKHRRTGLTKNTGDMNGSPDQLSDSNEFICVYQVAATNRGILPSALWLTQIVQHSWFINAIQRVVSRRRRHAPRANRFDLEKSLTARFIEILSVDPWLGLANSELESLLDRIEKRLDSCARHLFPKENLGKWHRPRIGPIVRHIEASSIPGVFDVAPKTTTPLQIAIANECIGAVDLALASLSVAERFILLAKYFNNQSVREIAEALGITKHCVDKLHESGLQKMRQALAGFD